MSPVKMTDRNNECNLFELCFLLQQEKKIISKQKLRFNSSKYKKSRDVCLYLADLENKSLGDEGGSLVFQVSIVSVSGQCEKAVFRFMFLVTSWYALKKFISSL